MGASGRSRRFRLLLAAAGALPLACGEPQQPTRPAGAFDRVVLVTIDTLRADHLGAYGYPRPTSPFLDGLAARGVLFERAYAAIATTAPSHATIFTSRYPAEHGVLRNALVLDDGFVTLAERFAAAGFETAGFVAAAGLFLKAGLGQGFATFDAPYRDGGLPYRPADETVDAAIAWLDGREARRAFLFVHLFDPHGPFAPPEHHLPRFALERPEQRALFARFLVDVRGVSPAAFDGDLQAMLDHYQRYDAEIRFADEELWRLFRAVEERSAKPALWIVTADHGQGMGSHRFLAHGLHIYEEQVRVPLVVAATDGAFPPRRVETLVEHVDLLPTLVELAGLPDDPAAPVRGRSLAPLLRGEDGAFAERPAFVQRRIYDDPRPERLPHYELGEKRALVGPRWKYIQRTIGGDELYDLADDPGEAQNLVGEEPEVRERMAAELRARERELAPDGVRRAEEDLDERARRQLEALGYAF